MIRRGERSLIHLIWYGRKYFFFWSNIGNFICVVWRGLAWFGVVWRGLPRLHQVQRFFGLSEIDFGDAARVCDGQGGFGLLGNFSLVQFAAELAVAEPDDSVKQSGVFIGVLFKDFAELAGFEFEKEVAQPSGSNLHVGLMDFAAPFGGKVHQANMQVA